ncbi:MAG: flippase activity-associated protein Agl23 [Bdellovibrionota bacterium]
MTRETSRSREFWVLSAILLLAFVLRSIYLEIKPPHFDEGINGHFVSRMWSDGYYRYDPTNFHGPLYFYILQLSELVLGWGITSFRFVTGLLSLAIVAVVAAHRQFIGRAAIWAAGLVAISPAFVFYSRYAIHESLFILSQVAFSYGALSWMRDRSVRSMWWMGLALVGLVTTKETFFIYVGTWLIAVAVTNAFEKHWPSVATRYRASVWHPLPAQHVVLVVFVCVFLVLALFTGFFMHPKGAGDMISALMVWTKTGTGKTGHEKEFIYYLKLMKDYEWPFLVSLLATPIVFFQVSRPARILVLVAFGSWLAYSLIPYKTPWLVLSYLWALAFCFGHLARGSLAMYRRWPVARWAVLTVLAVGFVHSVSQMLRLNFRDYADPKERYVYVQTSQEFKRAIEVLESLVKVKPEARNLNIVVVNKDPWPLPYVLLPFPNNTWAQAATATYDNAQVILSDAVDRDLIISKLKGPYFVLPFQIRDAYQSGQAFFRHVDFKGVLPPETQVVEGAAK